jgi:hypothetical protein
MTIRTYRKGAGCWTAWATLVLLFCASCGDDTAPSNPPGGAYSPDAVLRLNHIQAKGTHNSYHVQPPIVFDPGHRYTHQPLDVQLEEQGVRQFELDLHLRADVGFEVFHLPLVDQQSTCRRFTDCLAIVKTWSDDHPRHAPIVIWLEPKDDAADWLFPDLLPISGHYDDLEAEILSVWPRERILTPDDVRGAHATLPEAIAAGGWPTLGQLRGRVLFSLLDSETHREEYLLDHPVLEGRLLFVDSSNAEDPPYAAMFKINDAQGDAELVRGLVTARYIVTSNVDNVEADDQANAQRLAASLEAGAHFLSSDFPAPVPDREFWFDLPGGEPARCNPVYDSGDPCTAADIESLD